MYAATEHKFVQQDPTSSTYSGRIRKDDRARLEPVIIRLHAAGASREKMLVQCNATGGAPISFAQLDGLRKKLGLHTYRKQPQGSLLQITVPQSTAISSPSVGMRYDEEVEDMVTDSESRPSQDKAMMTLFQKSLHLDDLRNADEFHLFEQDDSLQLGKAVDVEELGRSEIDLGCTTPRLSIAGNSITTDTSESTSDEGLNVFHALAYDEIQNPLSMSNAKSATSPDLDTHAFTAQSGFEMKFRSGDFKRMWQREVYWPSLPVVRFFLRSLAGGTEKPEIPRLLKVASLLHTLRAFEQAFDLFFILFQYLKEIQMTQQSDSPAHPLLIFAGIACSRSAQGRLQFRVARNMVHHIRPLTRVRHMHMHIINCLMKLEEHLDSIVQGLRDYLPPEDSVDAALWTLAPLALDDVTLNLRALPSDWPLGPTISLAVDNTLRCLQNRDDTPAAFVDALRIVYARDSPCSRSLNSLVLDHRVSADLGIKVSVQAQNVAYNVVKEYSKRSLAKDRSEITGSLSDIGFELDFLAAATIPFAMVDWIVQVGHMFDIGYAVEQLQQRSDTGRLTITHLIDLCFRQMSAPTTKWAVTTCGVSVDELLSDCNIIASGQHDNDQPIQRVDREDAVAAVEAQNGLDLQLQSVQSATLLPTLARSLRASNSSSLRSLLSMALRANHAFSHLSGGRESTTSDARTSRSSWKLSFMSTAPSSRMSMRQNVQTMSSDVEMTG